jgi:hypothetical protein
MTVLISLILSRGWAAVKKERQKNTGSLSKETPGLASL